MVRGRSWIVLGATASGVAVLVLGGAGAHAGWGWHHAGSAGGSYGGSYGGSVGAASYGSYGGSVGAASYGSYGGSVGAASYGSWGSHGGLLQRWHAHKMARRAAYASWGASQGGGSYGASNGGWASYGWSSAGASYGSTGEVYYSEGAIYEDSGTVIQEGAAVEGPAATPVPPQPTDGARGAVPSDSVLLTVHVPTAARIYVNGAATTSTGSLRRYVSSGLEAGRRYGYEVRAEWTQDGRTLQQVKSVNLAPGQQASLAFELGPRTPVETRLTLNVPQDAEVFLAGSPTSSTGSVRKFSTTRLARGEQWSDYAIRVTWERDGRTLSKEQVLTLRGGESQDVTVSFDEGEIAAR